MEEIAYPSQQPWPPVQRLESTVQIPPQEPQSQQQQVEPAVPRFVPSFRALPLLYSDLPHTTIEVLSHSFLRPDARGKEILSFVVFVNPNSGKEGWNVKKTYSDVLRLDKRVKNSVGKVVGKKIANLPEAKLWKDQVKIDQRKVVLEIYFQTLIQLPVKNNDEVIAFFTSDIVRDQKQAVMQTGYKDGFLSKQGKNFDGWRTRFFVLQGPVLEYYDCDDGVHLGSIVITGAMITRQNLIEGPPSEEKEYRHAFLIVEAKKGYGGSHPLHVLCAESDEHRDSWISMLVRYYTGVYIDDLVFNPALGLTSMESDTVAATSQQSALVGQPQSRVGFGAPIPSGLKFGGIRGKEVPFAKPPSAANDRRERAKSRSFWGFGKVNGNKSPLQTVYPSRAVFGVSLEEALDVAQICNLPAIVFRAIQYLEEMQADQEEGIYRLTGSSTVIKKLKDMFNSDGDVDLLASDVSWDVHAITGLLKSFLRELPSNILTRDLHLKFMAVIDIVDPQERVKELSHLISTLPLANYCLLRALTAHLNLIAQNSNVNKMTVRNVGIVFGVTLGMPVGVFSLILGEFDHVFNVDADSDELGPKESEGAAENPSAILRPNTRQYSKLGSWSIAASAGSTTPSTEDEQSDDDDLGETSRLMNGASILSCFKSGGKEALSTELSTTANDKANSHKSEFLDMEEEEEEEEGFEQDAMTDNPGDITVDPDDTCAYTYIIEEYAGAEEEASSISPTAPGSNQTDKQILEMLESDGLLYPLDSLSSGNSSREIPNLDPSNAILGSENLITRSLTTVASPLDLSAFVTRDTIYPVHGGGYADVYSGILSRDNETTKVAIKVIRAHTFTETNQWKINKRLKREIRVWSGLQHPNIIPLLGTTQAFGPHTGMVCPWMSEGDLNHYLKERKPHLNLRRRLQILSDVVEGLVYLHTRSIIHGDLTTGNILMEDGKAHLGDFGLSNIMAQTRNGSLFSSTVGGAIRWAAPELYYFGPDRNGIPELTKPCDVYSFGSVALQVISGKIPYDNITMDVQVLLELMKGVCPARPAEKLLTDAAWELITFCWTQDPHQRPSIEEVRKLLQTLRYDCTEDLLESMIIS